VASGRMRVMQKGTGNLEPDASLLKGTYPAHHGVKCTHNPVAGMGKTIGPKKGGGGEKKRESVLEGEKSVQYPVGQNFLRPRRGAGARVKVVVVWKGEETHALAEDNSSRQYAHGKHRGGGKSVCLPVS